MECRNKTTHKSMLSAVPSKIRRCKSKILYYTNHTATFQLILYGNIKTKPQCYKTHTFSKLIPKLCFNWNMSFVPLSYIQTSSLHKFQRNGHVQNVHCLSSPFSKPVILTSDTGKNWNFPIISTFRTSVRQ